jgi:protein TonB
VSGERLADGSGLELLGQMQRSHREMLRIFAVERERRKLLKGRLGPFGLFRTLSYPIEPRQLLAALSAAAGFNEGDGETETVEVTAPAAPVVVALPQQLTVRSVRKTGPTATQMQLQAPAQQLAMAAPLPTTNVRRVAFQPPAGAAPGQASAPRARTAAPSPAPVQTATRPASRQPTAQALATGARLAAASRGKAFPPPLPLPLMDSGAKRSAVLVGAGVVAVVGALVLAMKVFFPAEPSTFSTARLTAPQNYPPEVVKLVADTEAAFQQDDFKAARTDIAALQQIAPAHPRLPFFESLLEQREAAAAAESPSIWRKFMHRTPAPPVRTVTPSPASTVRAASRPGTRGASSAAPAPAVASLSGAKPPSFSGKTVEDSSGSADTDVQEARLIERVPAEYPQDAERKGVEGVVDLSFVVSTQGDVRDITVLHSEPSGIFNRAAVSAVRRWKYRPKTVKGSPVEAHVQLRVTFKLDDAKKG